MYEHEIHALKIAHSGFTEFTPPPHKNPVTHGNSKVVRHNREIRQILEGSAILILPPHTHRRKKTRTRARYMNSELLIQDSAPPPKKKRKKHQIKTPKCMSRTLRVRAQLIFSNGRKGQDFKIFDLIFFKIFKKNFMGDFR